MKNALIAIAAAVIATTGLITSEADAASKKLNFGYPLGSFTAHSNSSKAGVSKRKHRAAQNKAAAHKRAAAKKRAAARQRAAAAQRLREKRAAQAKLARQREVARQRKIAEAKKRERAARVARIQAEKKAAKLAALETPETVEETVNEVAEAKPAPVKASAIAGVNRLLPDEKAEDRETAEVAGADIVASDEEEVAPPAPVRSPDDTISCKRYVPSAGLTISVPCGD